MLASFLSNYANIFVQTLGRRNVIPTFNDFSSQLLLDENQQMLRNHKQHDEKTLLPKFKSFNSKLDFESHNKFHVSQKNQTCIP
jgi:hypothetical protein